MKRIILTLVATAFLSVSSLFATTNHVVSAKDSKTITIQLDNNSQSSDIVLTDKFGVVLHKEEVEAQNYTAEFDLNYLPNGTYSLTITSNTNNQIDYTLYDVTIKGEQVTVGSEIKERIIKPTVNVEGSELVVSMLSLNKSTPVTVIFSDAQGNFVDSDQFKVKETKVKKYNLSTLPKGDYDVRFYFAGDMVKQNFSIQ